MAAVNNSSNSFKCANLLPVAVLAEVGLEITL